MNSGEPKAVIDLTMVDSKEDKTWALQLSEIRIKANSDLTENQKAFMILWNKENPNKGNLVRNEKLISRACLNFVSKTMEEIITKNLETEALEHFLLLRKMNIIKSVSYATLLKHFHATKDEVNNGIVSKKANVEYEIFYPP